MEKLECAMIQHEYGATFLLGNTPKELEDKVYEWVKQYWSERTDEPIPKDKIKAKNDYFEMTDMEYIWYGQAEL